MNNYKLKKMLVEAGKELKAAQEKYAEIERRLKGGASTSYILLFENGSYKEDFDKKITEFKSSMEALEFLNETARKINVSEISKCIKDGDVLDGDVIALPYEDEKLGIDTVLPFNVCRITKNDEALCHCRFALDRVQFSANASNNYKNSDIRKWLGNLISRFDDAMQKHFVQVIVSCIDACDEKIEIVPGKFWLLDQIELFTFYKTKDERKLTYLIDNAAANWWLRYPNTDTVHGEYFVNTSGSSDYNTGYYSHGCAPACLIG